MPIKTIDIPPGLNDQIKTEKEKHVYNGNYSAVVRTALVYFFDRNHTSMCEQQEARS